jgi:hypothetical protein
MTSYRVYPLNPAGRIAGAPLLVECMSDAEAIVQGRRLAAGTPAEVWNLERFVGRLPGETPLRLLKTSREISH